MFNYVETDEVWKEYDRTTTNIGIGGSYDDRDIYEVLKHNYLHKFYGIDFERISRAVAK
jgi:hypothetical protein